MQKLTASSQKLPSGIESAVVHLHRHLEGSRQDQLDVKPVSIAAVVQTRGPSHALGLHLRDQQVEVVPSVHEVALETAATRALRGPTLAR